MRQLRLVGLTEDGASLQLETPTGEPFRLPLDERLRAACRGDLTRLGQIEIETESTLRPREIQARVRAGESAEEVAADAGASLDRVLRFAYPVLQERERVVAQARVTPVRPRSAETLAELVEQRLVGRGTDAATLRWDAWRREDGRWTVRLSWRHAAEHAATWTFDLARRVLHPDDPAAEQLSAEEFHARTITAVTPLAVAARSAAGPETQGPRGSTPVPSTQAPGAPDSSVGPGASAAVQRGKGGDRTRGRAAGRQRSGARGAVGAEEPSDAGGDEEPARRVAAGGGTGAVAAGGSDGAEDADDDRARRASVPSWDDILLGVRRRH
jgi:Protein of unknown function (DUF3071)